MPIVSIIVPVYNAQDYLHKCINSLLNQSFSDFEIILVNDGSKDNSKEICEEFAKSDNRIKVIHKENGGVSSARNCGIDEACGKYIMFCDSDDFVKEDFCKPLVELAEGKEDCLVLAGITEIHDGINKDDLCAKYPEGEKLTLSNQDFCDLYVELNLKGQFLLMNMPYNKLFSRSVIEKHHLRFDTKINYNEDFIFNILYLEKVSEVKIYNKSIYNYYMDTPGSLCKKYVENLIDIYHIKEDVLKSVIINKASNQHDARIVWSTFVFNDTNRAINNTFSPSNPANNRERVKYCNKLIRNKEFQKSIKYANKNGYNKLYVLMLRLRNYRLIQLLKKIS